MAGLTPGSPTPQSITVHGQSRQLELVFSDGAAFRLPFELLRVYSPSAEVMGHAPGQEVLHTGKRNVEIADIEPVVGKSQWRDWLDAPGCYQIGVFWRGDFQPKYIGRAQNVRKRTARLTSTSISPIAGVEPQC